MSGRGDGRSRVGRKVRRIVTSITGTQPAPSTPLEDVGSPDPSAHTVPSSSSAVATPVEEPSRLDSEGRIIVNISLLKQ